MDKNAVVEAARALLDKLELIHADPRYKSVWLLMGNRGMPYCGPKYEAELAALKQALAQPVQEPQIGLVSACDDGSEVWLDSFSGGAHKDGLWSHLSLRFVEEDGTEVVRNYHEQPSAPVVPGGSDALQKHILHGGWKCKFCGSDGQDNVSMNMFCVNCKRHK